MNTRELGFKGEQKAISHLIKSGFTILAKNYYSEYGEVDIIAKRGETIHFIEVKTWSNLAIENLEYSINKYKKNKIIKTALMFLREYSIDDVSLSFDIIFNNNLELKHLISAIEGDDFE